MKHYFRIILFAAACLAFIQCNKKDDNKEKTKEDLPASVQHHLETCSGNCQAYVQLVTLGGQTFFYLGYNGPVCDQNPSRSAYMTIEGTVIPHGTELHTQLQTNGVLVNEIYNCD